MDDIPTNITKEDLESILSRMGSPGFWVRSIPQNRETITAYFEGFDDAKSPKPTEDNGYNFYYQTCLNLFSTYIYRKYGIRHISWQRQVDTFAYRNTMNWEDAFYNLFYEFTQNFPKDTIDNYYNPKLIYSSPEEKRQSKYEVISPDFNSLNSLTIDGIKIEVGTILKLVDKIGEDYKKTIHHDIDIKEPSWELYEPSNKDYNFVRFCHIKEFYKNRFDFETLESVVLNRVRRICSGFTSEVKLINKKNSKYFVYTKDFEIEIQLALDGQEVEVVTERGNKDEKWDNYFINRFHESVVYYQKGLSILDKTFKNFYWELINSPHYIEWVNYYWTFGGWIRKKDNMPINADDI